MWDWGVFFVTIGAYWLGHWRGKKLSHKKYFEVGYRMGYNKGIQKGDTEFMKMMRIENETSETKPNR